MSELTLKEIEYILYIYIFKKVETGSNNSLKEIGIILC